ncbi:MAG TPA: RNA polymerase factor sigma-32, partial [Rhodospirillaceae bacterium]|nr:RNA polymerase factor sigma-32 [Rhodospirillaceae bacterium]
QESRLGEHEELSERRGMLSAALQSLSERERHIIEERRLKDTPATLQDLSAEYGIS